MRDFDAAHRSALISDLLAYAAGRSADLLPFDDVRREFHLRHLVDRGIQEISLDRIVGSLNRPTEFNRFFLPRDEALRGRWEEIRELAEGPRGFPPVELYQVDQAYFVVDGHHRVSVARSLGAPSIEAHVTEFLTPVPLDPGASLEDILLRHGLAEFLELTGLRPETPGEFRITVADGYQRLVEHIRVHGYYKGIETGRDIPWPEEVASWRGTVYRPMIEIIRHSGILAEFPGRTETDLYLFVMDHLYRLRQQYGDPQLPLETAMEAFEQERREKPRGRWRTWLHRLRRLISQ